MRQFFKFVMASCLGTILAFGAVILIFMMIGLSSAPQNVVSSGSMLHIKLDHAVPELTDNVEQGSFTLEPMVNIGLHDLRRTLEYAATDPNIKGILLQTEMAQVGTTKAIEIAQYISEFKEESGKPVHAYGDYFSQTGYIVASAADSIYLNPNGLVALTGYGSVRPYYKNFSDKFGIKFDVYHAGKFKSAVEPFYLSKSSEANRLQTHVYLDEYMERTSEIIAQNRNLEIPKVETIISQALASDDAQDALSLGLIDGIRYWQDYEAGLKDQLDINKIKLESLPSYKSKIQLPRQSGSDRIAVIYAEGEIGMTGDDKGEITMERYRKALERVRDKDNIKALVLRVDSPGGSAFTSDDFWSYIQDIKAAGKYVVASFGTYAASGGYYIACGADRIVAEPTTLTGSIGVFSVIPDFSEFSEERLGINWDTIGTGQYTFMFSPFVDRGPAQDARLMSSTEQLYDRFLQRVADGRDMTKEEVHKIAQGRVWSGEAGVEVGIVDTLGDLQDAIAIAAAHIESDDYKILQYPVIEKNIYEEMLTQIANDLNAHVDIAKVLGIDTRITSSKTAQQLAGWIEHVEQACETPQARLPWMIIE